MLNYAATAYRGDDAFILKKKNGGDVTYKHIKFEEFLDDVNALGTGLMKRGLLDKRVAIIGKNRYEWVLAYFAVLCGGGICVPLDKGLPMEEAESSLERSYADVVVFDKDHTDMINEIRKKADSRYTIVIMAAKRARDIIEGKPVLAEDYKVNKPVSIAAVESAEDLITYKRES